MYALEMNLKLFFFLSWSGQHQKYAIEIINNLPKFNHNFAE